MSIFISDKKRFLSGFWKIDRSYQLEDTNE